MKLETHPATPGPLHHSTTDVGWRFKKRWLHPEDSGHFTQGNDQSLVINSPEGKGQFREAQEESLEDRPSTEKAT